MDEKPEKPVSPNRLDAITFSTVRVLVLTVVVGSVLLLAFCQAKEPAGQLAIELKIALMYIVPVVVVGAIVWMAERRDRRRIQ